MEEKMRDNSKLEKLMKIDSDLPSPEQERELIEELKQSQLILPVIIKQNPFGDIENLKVGDVISPDEQMGFDINFFTDENGNKAIPLFTSHEIMSDLGLESSTIVMYAADIANMLKEVDEKYNFVIINPLTELRIDLPILAFINLFEENYDAEELEEALNEILGLIAKHSIELEEKIALFVRSEYNFMKESSIDGIFTARMPLNASTEEDFNADLPFLNIILMDEGKKMLYLGDMVEEDQYDSIIAPGTEFELFDELDENTTVWKCGKQPFYEE